MTKTTKRGKCAKFVKSTVAILVTDTPPIKAGEDAVVGEFGRKFRATNVDTLSVAKKMFKDND